MGIEKVRNFLKNSAGATNDSEGKHDRVSAEEGASGKIADRSVGLYSNLSDFVTKQLETRECMKKFFFGFVVFIFFSSLVCVGLLSYKLYPSAESNAVPFVSAVLSGLGALLVLPKIIAEYLFSKDESKAITELIKDIAVEVIKKTK